MCFPEPSVPTWSYGSFRFKGERDFTSASSVDVTSGLDGMASTHRTLAQSSGRDRARINKIEEINTGPGG